MANAYPPLKKPNSALQPLGALVGEWELAVVFPADPSKVISGKVVFEWLENGAYLVMRSQPDSGLPESVSVIGSDEASDNFLMLYFDSRDVARAYQMSFKDGVWKIWGTAKDFVQRFTGKLEQGGSTITAEWEKSLDNKTWQHDFDITYTRIHHT